MKPKKIINGVSYEIAIGKTASGAIKKAVMKVIEKNLVTKTWRCETRDGKEMKVKDPARFLKEIKMKTSEPDKCANTKGKTMTPQKSVAEVSPEVKEALKNAANETRVKARIASELFEAGVGKMTQAEVDAIQQEADAAKQKAIAAGVSFGGKNGRSFGKMGGKEAALRILKEENRPMNARELCTLAHERGYCELRGLTPDVSIAAAIATDIKRKGSQSQFKRVGKGLFMPNDKAEQ